MSIASDLLRRHFEVFVQDDPQWSELIADDILWQLAYAAAIGHPQRLSGRDEVLNFVSWFRGAVESFRFFDLNVYPFADDQAAVAEVKAEGIIKATGRIYRQDYVMFLRCTGGKISFLREYYDPVRAAKALDTPILGMDATGRIHS
jgi:ketosteroid isomerase-like protein